MKQGMKLTYDRKLRKTEETGRGEEREKSTCNPEKRGESVKWRRGNIGFSWGTTVFPFPISPREGLFRWRTADHNHYQPPQPFFLPSLVHYQADSHFKAANQANLELLSLLSSFIILTQTVNSSRDREREGELERHVESWRWKWENWKNHVRIPNSIWTTFGRIKRQWRERRGESESCTSEHVGRHKERSKCSWDHLSVGLEEKTDYSCFQALNSRL